MKKIVVPKSIRKIAIKNIFLRVIVLLVLLWVADCFVEYLYLYIVEEARNNGNLSFCILGLYSIPFFISGIPFKLFDGDWYGEIISIDLKNNERTNDAQKADFTQTALIKTEKGKLKYHKIFDEGELFYGNRKKVYNIGDKVVHVYGMNYITPIRTLNKELPIVCVVCGNKNSCGSKTCRQCGNSVVEVV